MSAVRYQRNLSSNPPRPSHDLAPHRHAVALDRVARPGLRRLLELAEVARDDAERPGDADRGLGERRARADRTRRRSASIEPSITITTRPRRPAQPGVGARPPSRCRAPAASTSTSSPRTRRVAAGDVGDDVVHATASLVRTERVDRPRDVAGPPLDDPVHAHVVGRGLRRACDGTSAGRSGSRAAPRAPPPAPAATRLGSSTTVQPAAAISSRSASAAGEVLRRPRPGPWRRPARRRRHRVRSSAVPAHEVEHGGVGGVGPL